MHVYLTSFNDSAVDPEIASSDPEAYQEETRRLRREHARVEERLTELFGTGRRYYRRVRVPTPRMGADERSMWEELDVAALHRLRAFAAHVEFEEEAPTDLADYGSELGTSLLESLYANEFRSERFRMLIHHADSSGYYVPVDFPTPVEDETLSVGSLQRLAQELATLRPFLGDPIIWNELEEGQQPWPEGSLYPTEVRTWSILSWLVRHALHKSLSVEYSE